MVVIYKDKEWFLNCNRFFFDYNLHHYPNKMLKLVGDKEDAVVKITEVSLEIKRRK